MSAISLKQMAEDKENPAVSKLTGFYVDPRILEFEEGFNLRIETKALQASIDALEIAYINGAVFPPIDVKVVDGRVILRDGHRRTRAVLQAIAKGHDARRMEAREFKGNDADSVRHMMGTADSRQLSTLEKGIGYKRLLRMGWTKQEVCADRNVSITHLEQALTLANANSDVQILLADELVSVSAALDALREHGEDAGKVLQTMVEDAPTEVAEDGQERRKKVTRRETNAARKPVVSRALPRKLTDRYVSSVGTLFGSMTDDFRARIVTATDDAMIPVSARHLKELLAAHAETVEIRGSDTNEGDPVPDPRQGNLLTASA
ncbi:conserved hypothetical protein (plasmid) [Paraburkholderia phytofirmans PsJN]|uniref:ParB domain protein nuclease n=2 Tax=Paraburkholderia phytofirmans TaxID=261302 RepID=B2TH47_PARPJ|nr:conserved hypothetical protein [Paraburkholderia phytofirmans PsJN]